MTYRCASGSSGFLHPPTIPLANRIDPRLFWFFLRWWSWFRVCVAGIHFSSVKQVSASLRFGLFVHFWFRVSFGPLVPFHPIRLLSLLSTFIPLCISFVRWRLHGLTGFHMAGSARHHFCIRTSFCYGLGSLVLKLWQSGIAVHFRFFHMACTSLDGVGLLTFISIWFVLLFLLLVSASCRCTLSWQACLGFWSWDLVCCIRFGDLVTGFKVLAGGLFRLFHRLSWLNGLATCGSMLLNRLFSFGLSYFHGWYRHAFIYTGFGITSFTFMHFHHTTKHDFTLSCGLLI